MVAARFDEVGKRRGRKNQRRGRAPGREGRSAGSGRRRGDDARRRGGQAMQTSRVVAWRARARAPCPSSAYWREEEGDREEEVGWAAQCWTSTGAGPALVAARVRPGRLCSFISFSSVLFLFNLLPLF